jgi:hypothetical protein
MDFQMLEATPFIYGVLETLNRAETDREDVSAKNAVKSLKDKIEAGKVEYRWEQGEVSVYSSQTATGKERDGNMYVCTKHTCTCPSGVNRKAALQHNKNNPDQVYVKMCWHIQLARLLSFVYAMESIVGEVVFAAMLRNPVKEVEVQAVEKVVPATHMPFAGSFIAA